MKSWIRFVALFYPGGWRAEFGDEFDAVLDDVRPGWRVFGNVLKGAVEMQISESRNWLKIAGAMALVGALVALGLSFAVRQNYSSSATVAFVPQSDPVRSASPEVLQQRAVEHVNEMRVEVMSRYVLASIINDPSLELYRAELKKIPMEDVVQQMRGDLQVRVVSNAKDGPVLLRISFLYPDRAKAEAVVLALQNKFVQQNRNTIQSQTDAYNGFWADMSQFRHAPPAPPPPVGEVVHASRVNPPIQSPPNRVVFLAWGVLAGLLAGLAIRWPRNFFRLAGFALAGFVLAAGVSFLFPNRFTSIAEMQIESAQITEDPHISPPPATPAVTFLRDIEPQIVSSAGLESIIEDPRFNLYSEERKRKPIEDIVSEMRANLRIMPEFASASASAFHIYFTYPDRFKAQQVVQVVMTKVFEMNQVRQKPSEMDFMQHVIWERKSGETLNILDVANLPSKPDGPPRLLIAFCGLAVGLLLGLFWLRRRRPEGPVSSTAPGGSASAYA